MSKILRSLLAASALAVAGGPALAQYNPSTDAITDALTPRAPTGATRGIRPLNPTTPATEAPASPTVPTPITPTTAAAPITPRVPPRPRPATPAVATEAAPSVNLTVQFASDSAQLTPAATRTLDALGRALSSSQLATYRFRIEGHTDTTGNPDHNQQLSDERARAVVDYLVTHFSIDRSRLDPIGMGENHLLVQTGQNIAEPRNRRVTVVNIGA